MTDKEFCERITSLCVNDGFGKYLKSRMDQEVFHYLLERNLGPAFKDGTRIRHLTIDKVEMRRLASKFRMTEARFSGFLEQDWLLFRHESADSDRFLLELIKNARMDKDSITEGQASLWVANPVALHWLEERLYLAGVTPQPSRSRDIVRLDLRDLLLLLDRELEPDRHQAMLDNIAARLTGAGSRDQATAFLAELTRKSARELAVDMLKHQGARLLGASVDEVFTSILESVKSFLKGA